jgi:hypothetical protein
MHDHQSSVRSQTPPPLSKNIHTIKRGHDGGAKTSLGLLTFYSEWCMIVQHPFHTMQVQGENTIKYLGPALSSTTGVGRATWGSLGIMIPLYVQRHNKSYRKNRGIRNTGG